jgi:ATP-dependent DNA helicase RecG
MTATPIPRTLTLAAFGDLDVSRLDEKPPGRAPISTRAVPLDRLEELYEAVGRAVKKGDRVYWVCPLVEESDTSDLAAAEERWRALAALYGESRVGLLHGRLSGAEKEARAEAFRHGEIDVLVATTVVEVGVDAPDATVMIIEDAERFGLAQLHQLRGRVGRGDKPSTCVLLYRPPLNEGARARLDALRASDDGFFIAEEDWRLRGPGELLGHRQSGIARLRFADLTVHGDLLEIASRDARRVVDEDPRLSSERGEAARTLLYLFDRDRAIGLLDAG